MLRPLRHSKIKKVFERKVPYVVFTLPDTDRIVMLRIVYSGPIPISMHVPILMQIGTAPYLLPRLVH